MNDSGIPTLLATPENLNRAVNLGMMTIKQHTLVLEKLISQVEALEKKLKILEEKLKMSEQCEFIEIV